MPSSQAQKSINQAMFKATKLAGVGKLLDATRGVSRAEVTVAEPLSPANLEALAAFREKRKPNWVVE